MSRLADAAALRELNRYVPVCEPYRARWDVLHEAHVLLLQAADRGDEHSLRQCPRIADSKYLCYLESLDVARGREVLRGSAVLGGVGLGLR